MDELETNGRGRASRLLNPKYSEKGSKMKYLFKISSVCFCYDFYKSLMQGKTLVVTHSVPVNINNV